MSLKNKIVLLVAAALPVIVFAGPLLCAEAPEVAVEEELVEEELVVAPPAYLVCSRHDFGILKESGITRCVICDEELKPVASQKNVKVFGALGWLTLQGDELEAAGVVSKPMERRTLYIKIQTTGRFAITAGVAKDASQPEQVWVYGSLSGPDSRYIRPDSEIILSTESQPDWQWRGTMLAAQLSRDPKSGNLRFRLKFDGTGLQLKPEMEAKVSICSLYRGPFLTEDSLVLPPEACRGEGPEQIVWIDKGHGNFEMYKVTVGPPTVAQKEGEAQVYRPVLKGLTGRECIVTRATFFKN